MSDRTLNVPIKRTRAKNLKSRAGCLTCKKRHIKCDETKPFCNRCLRSAGYCEGYRTRVSDTKLKRLIPKLAPQSPVYPLSYNLFANDQEQYCFRLFSEKTALRLSGCFESNLWSRLVLQACHTDSAIRHAVVAIGALDFISEITQVEFLPLGNGAKKNCEETQKHHRFALWQFGTALRELRRSTAEGKVDMRSTLLGCIVISCFETYHGNYQTAIKHLQTGLALMEEWHQQKSHNLPSTVKPSNLSTDPIEEELYQSIGRLDIQLMSFVDSRSKETHERMRRHGTAKMEAMPGEFLDLSEARMYLELVMRRIMHFRSSLSPSRDYNGCLRIPGPLDQLPSDAMVAHKDLKQELQRWCTSFNLIWQHTDSKCETKSAQAATALQIHYLTSQLVIDAIPLESVAAKSFASRSTVICQNIVFLAQRVLESSQSLGTGANFSFDLQVVTPLYIVGMRCRSLKIRRQAIGLLRSFPRREGLWDSLLVSKSLAWVADMEGGEDLEEDSMPEGTGVIDMTYDFDSETQSVRITCRQVKEGASTHLVKRVTIPWG